MDNKKEDCRKTVVLCMAVFQEPVKDNYDWCRFHEPLDEDFPDCPPDYCKYCELQKIGEDTSVFVCRFSGINEQPNIQHGEFYLVENSPYEQANGFVYKMVVNGSPLDGLTARGYGLGTPDSLLEKGATLTKMVPEQPLQKWLPGSDIQAGYYWLTSNWDSFRVIEVVDYRNDDCIKPYDWKYDRKMYVGHVLYGPIPQPEVSK